MAKTTPMAYSERLFDCRRYIKPGDIITFDFEIKDGDFLTGVGKVVAVYEQFVTLALTHTCWTVNRWDIKSLNGHDVVGGCFRKFETLEDRKGGIQ